MNEHATLNAIDYAVFFVYMALTLVLGFAVSIISFMAPEAVLGLMSSEGIILVMPYVFAILFSGLLIMLLMRTAANTLQE